MLSKRYVRYNEISSNTRKIARKELMSTNSQQATANEKERANTLWEYVRREVISKQKNHKASTLDFHTQNS